MVVERSDRPEVCDKVTDDNYPRKGEIHRQNRIGRAHLKVPTATVDAPTHGAPGVAPPMPAPSRVSKRGREGDNGGHTTSTKRSRVEAILIFPYNFPCILC